VRQPRREQLDVEAQAASAQILFLLGRAEQVDEQRGEPALPQRRGDEPVARAVATAPAAVREEDERPRRGAVREVAVELHVAEWDAHRLLVAHHGVRGKRVAASRWKSSSSRTARTWPRSSSALRDGSRPGGSRQRLLAGEDVAFRAVPDGVVAGGLDVEAVVVGQ
jgi:hypothetical protein